MLGYVNGYKAPRTPWGDPDLQGIWNGNDLQGVPTTRAATVGTRMILTDDEHRQRVAQRDRVVESDNLDFDLEKAEEFASMGTVGGPVSPPQWLRWLRRRQPPLPRWPATGGHSELALAQGRAAVERLLWVGWRKPRGQRGVLRHR